MGRIEPQRLARVPRTRTGSDGLRAVCGAARRQTSRRESAEGLWRGWSRGNYRGLSRRYFPRGLYIAFRQCGLRPTRFPEEIEDRTRDAASRSSADQATAARNGTDCERYEAMSKKGYESGDRNVFKDIGVPNAEEHLVKAQLVFKIDTIMKKRQLKQVEAAGLFGVRQPDVSKMLRGEFRQFSVERLLRFLVALDQDVEIVVKPHHDRKKAAALQVY